MGLRLAAPGSVLYLALLQHVDPVGQGQDTIDVLLDDEQGHTGSGQTGNCCAAVWARSGRFEGGVFRGGRFLAAMP